MMPKAVVGKIRVDDGGGADSFLWSVEMTAQHIRLTKKIFRMTLSSDRNKRLLAAELAVYGDSIQTLISEEF